MKLIIFTQKSDNFVKQPSVKKLEKLTVPIWP